MFSKISNEVFNTIHLGFSFLLLFSADFTLNNLMPTLYRRIGEDNPEFEINGFVALAGLYFFYATFLWVAPSINNKIKPKIGMVIGSLLITIHMFVIEFEIPWLIYLGIILSGIGGSLIWVGEGNYMVLNSKGTNVTRNISIFWTLYTMSMIIGNLYVACMIHWGSDLDKDSRVFITRVLTGSGIASSIFLCLLKKPAGVSDGQFITQGPIQDFVKICKLYISKDMMFLFFTFVYGDGKNGGTIWKEKPGSLLFLHSFHLIVNSTCFQQSFGWGIYETCMGFTKLFGPGSIQLVPLSGLTYGIGNFLGGFFHMVISQKMKIKYQRGLIICLSGIIQTSALIFTFVNLPNDSVFGPTYKKSLIEPSIGLGLACSFFLGLGDSCLNTQIFSLLAHLHPDYSAHTSALYKFTKSMAMVAFFFIGISIGLHFQILIIVIFCIIGTVAFLWVDFKTYDSVLNYPVCIDLL